MTTESSTSTTLSKAEWTFGSETCKNKSGPPVLRGHRLDSAGVWKLARTLSVATEDDARMLAAALTGPYTKKVPSITQKTWSGKQLKPYSILRKGRSTTVSERTKAFELETTTENFRASAKTHALFLPSQAEDYEEPSCLVTARI